MANLKILVAGAAGRMGSAIIREVLATTGLSLAGGFERAGHDAIGKDIGPLVGLDSLGLVVEPSAQTLMPGADALIDFTAPAATLANARMAADSGVAHIIGTTGFSEEQEKELRALTEKTVIVKSGNMSLGVNLLAALSRQAARRLGPEYDIEIVEAHHRAKVDAPSGTAIMLGHAAAAGRGVAETTVERASRKGPREVGAIEYAVIRGGGIVGDHHVMFAGKEEIITLSHRAIDRGLFAKGAVAAAKWATSQQPGLYSMADVLGFTE
ncbi:MAG: 4-hydroxy-tetrahydrodipicolinate reductase [Parvularculaceae bacterium]|nr:4-hydroxy-tetrahydrodipicolinate reductase [Parvularculaceae bacterium]